MATKNLDPQTAKNEVIYNLIADHARRAFGWLDIVAGEYSAADIVKEIKRGRAHWQYDENGDELAKAVTVENDGFTCSFRLRDVFYILAKVATAWRIRTRARASFIREEEEEQPANVATVAAAAGNYNKIVFCSIPRPAADEEPANVADDDTATDDTATDDTTDDTTPARVAWLRPLRWAAAVAAGIVAALLLTLSPEHPTPATATNTAPAAIAAPADDMSTQPANVATVADTLEAMTNEEPAPVGAADIIQHPTPNTQTADTLTTSEPANVADTLTTSEPTTEPANVADDDTATDDTAPATIDDDTTDDDTTANDDTATDDEQNDEQNDGNGATTSGTTTANGSTTTTTTTTTTTAPATASGSPAPAVAAAGL